MKIKYLSENYFKDVTSSIKIKSKEDVMRSVSAAVKKSNLNKIRETDNGRSVRDDVVHILQLKYRNFNTIGKNDLFSSDIQKRYATNIRLSSMPDSDCNDIYEVCANKLNLLSSELLIDELCKDGTPCYLNQSSNFSEIIEFSDNSIIVNIIYEPVKSSAATEMEYAWKDFKNKFPAFVESMDAGDLYYELQEYAETNKDAIIKKFIGYLQSYSRPNHYPTSKIIKCIGTCIELLKKLLKSSNKFMSLYAGGYIKECEDDILLVQELLYGNEFGNNTENLIKEDIKLIQDLLEEKYKTDFVINVTIKDSTNQAIIIK